METFVDIMLTTPTDQGKKAKILDLMNTRASLLPSDPEFKFDLPSIYSLTWNDCSFFVEVMKILYHKVVYDRLLTG